MGEISQRQIQPKHNYNGINQIMSTLTKGKPFIKFVFILFI